jgi:hypothetical protein
MTSSLSLQVGISMTTLTFKSKKHVVAGTTLNEGICSAKAESQPHPVRVYTQEVFLIRIL